MTHLTQDDAGGTPGSKNRTKPLKTRHGLVWFFIYFRGPVGPTGQRRHYSESTTRRYIRFIERFAQHFHCSPGSLGPQHIREYQAQLFTVRKLTPGTVTNHLCALRFLYIQTLKRPWSIADTPYPKKRYRLPTVLSQEEVTQLNHLPLAG